MDGYLSMKMKRKNLEEVSHEFSDFSLSSPARKIRRLDADLPPIIEEPIDYDQIMPEVGQQRVSPIIPAVEEDDVIIVPCSENEERAIVLYKPMNSPPPNSLSSFEVTVNSDLIPSIKAMKWVSFKGKNNPELWELVVVFSNGVNSRALSDSSAIPPKQCYSYHVVLMIPQTRIACVFFVVLSSDFRLNEGLLDKNCRGKAWKITFPCNDFIAEIS